MEMRNCPRCGKLFTYMNSPICERCDKAEEQIFNTVRDYIKENPKSKLNEVSEQTGASFKKIMKYIKEGRLEISKGMTGEVTCDQCGKPITKGRFCDSCVIKINQDVSEMFNGDKRDVARMHTAGKTKK